MCYPWPPDTIDSSSKIANHAVELRAADVRKVNSSLPVTSLKAIIRYPVATYMQEKSGCYCFKNLTEYLLSTTLQQTLMSVEVQVKTPWAVPKVPRSMKIQFKRRFSWYY